MFHRWSTKLKERKKKQRSKKCEKNFWASSVLRKTTRLTIETTRLCRKPRCSLIFWWKKKKKKKKNLTFFPEHFNNLPFFSSDQSITKNLSIIDQREINSLFLRVILGNISSRSFYHSNLSQAKFYDNGYLEIFVMIYSFRNLKEKKQEGD